MSGIMLNFAGVTATSVPGAPTIGAATATGATTATVAYTAPASNGGSVITSYTATSSPSGITGTLSQAGSGTITVSGLTGNTSYTFTVTATNAIGTSAASSASNSITTVPVVGQVYGGGYFAGQISTSGNSVADYNLVVGPMASANALKRWSSPQVIGDPTSVIDGPGNSTYMNSSAYPAAFFCKGLTIGGYSDWYMPARNEMEVCYYNLKPTTGSNDTGSGINANAVPARASNYSAGTPARTSATDFQSGGAEAYTTIGNPGDYWVSTSVSQYTAQCTRMSAGGQYTDGKNYAGHSVRAIRRVAV